MKTKTQTGHVESWYSQSSRSWVTQKVDEEGNQIGHADYNGTKEGRDVSHNNAVKEMNQNG